jgi:hypothetical protein
MTTTKTDRPFSWSRIWTKLFVAVVTIAIAAQVYSFLTFRAEIGQRRVAFCQSENESNRKQVLLWEKVIAISAQDQTEPQTESDRERVRQLRAFLKETFPVRRCG